MASDEPLYCPAYGDEIAHVLAECHLCPYCGYVFTHDEMDLDITSKTKRAPTQITETDLKYALLLEAPRSLPNVRLFVRPIMRVRLDDPDRTVSVGIKGQADLYGLVRGGRHIELELKSATGTMKKKQLAWRAFCAEWGVPHLVLKAKADETPESTVMRWVGEIREVIDGALA